MVSLNITNLPQELYNRLLEKKGQLHLRTWGQYLAWSLEDPEGLIDFEILSVRSCTPGSTNEIISKITFRAGNMVYEYDGSKRKDDQIKLIQSIQPKGSMVLALAKNR